MSIKLRQHFEKTTPLTEQEFEYILSAEGVGEAVLTELKKN
jgi:hypothetical protein